MNISCSQTVTVGNLTTVLCFSNVMCTLLLIRVAPDLIFSNPAGAGFGIADPAGAGAGD